MNNIDSSGSSFKDKSESRAILSPIVDNSIHLKIINKIETDKSMKSNDIIKNPGVDIMKMSTGDCFYKNEFKIDRKGTRLKYSANNLSRLKDKARKSLRKTRKSKQWSKKPSKMRNRMKELINRGLHDFKLVKRKCLKSAKGNALSASYSGILDKNVAEVIPIENRAFSKYNINQKQDKRPLSRYCILNLETESRRKSRSSQIIKAKINSEHHILEIKLKKNLIEQTYCKNIPNHFEHVQSGGRTLRHCSCTLKFETNLAQDLLRYEYQSSSGIRRKINKHEGLKSVKCRTSICVFNVRNRQIAHMDGNSKMLKMKSRIINLDNPGRFKKKTHNPRVSQTAKKIKNKKMTNRSGKQKDTKYKFSHSTSLLSTRRLKMSGRRKNTQANNLRLRKRLCTLQFQKGQNKHQVKEILHSKIRVSGTDWNTQPYRNKSQSSGNCKQSDLNANIQNENIPMHTKELFSNKTKLFYKKDLTTIRLTSQSTLISSTSCIQVLQLSSDFSCKLNFNLSNKYLNSPVTNIYTARDKSKYNNSFSRTYYTMNVHKIRTKLDPNECEPGVCIPYECDPYECQKLILKRLGKTISKMSGTGDHNKKRTAAGATQYGKTKKAKAIQSENYKKQTKNAHRQTDGYNKNRGIDGRDPMKRNKNAQSGVSLGEIASGIKRLKRCFCTLHFQTTKHNKEIMTGNRNKEASSQGLNRSHTREIDPHECEPYTCIPGQCNPNECLERIIKRNKGYRTRKLNVASRKKLTSCECKSDGRYTSNQYNISDQYKYGQVEDKKSIKFCSNFSFSVEFASGQNQAGGHKDKIIKNTQSTVSSPGRYPGQARGTGMAVPSQARGIGHRKKGGKLKDAGVDRDRILRQSRGSSTGRPLRNKGEDSRYFRNRDSQAQIQMTKDQFAGTLKRCFCTLKLHKVGDALSEQVVVVHHKGVKPHGKKPDLQTKGVAADKFRPQYSRTTGATADWYSPPTSRTAAVGANKYKPQTARARGAAADRYMQPTSRTMAVAADRRRMPTSRTTSVTANRRRQPNFYTKGIGADMELSPNECEPGTCVPDKCDPYECDKRIRRRRHKNENIKQRHAQHGSSRSEIQFQNRYVDPRNQNQWRPIQSNTQVAGSRQALQIGSNVSVSIEFFTKRNPPHGRAKLVGDTKSNINPLKRCFCTKSLNKTVPVYQLTNYTGVLKNYNHKYCSNLQTIQSNLNHPERTLSNHWTQETCTSSSSNPDFQKSSQLFAWHTDQQQLKNIYNRKDLIQKCYDEMEMHAHNTWNPKNENDNKDVKILFLPKSTIFNKSEQHTFWKLCKCKLDKKKYINVSPIITPLSTSTSPQTLSSSHNEIDLKVSSSQDSYLRTVGSNISFKSWECVSSLKFSKSLEEEIRCEKDRNHQNSKKTCKENSSFVIQNIYESISFTTKTELSYEHESWICNDNKYEEWSKKSWYEGT